MTCDVIDRGWRGRDDGRAATERKDETDASLPPFHPLLRGALLGDAAASAGMGLLLAGAAHPLASVLALPEPLLLGAGLMLLPYAGLIAWLGSRSRLPRWAVRGAIAVNLLWVADSALLLALGIVSPNGLGTGFVLLQAAAVLGFALLQWAGLRQATTASVPMAFPA